MSLFWILGTLFAILFGYGRMEKFEADHYRGEAQNAEQNAQQWHSFGEIQEQNATLTISEIKKEQEIGNQDQTDNIIADNVASAYWDE